MSNGLTYVLGTRTVSPSPIPDPCLLRSYVCFHRLLCVRQDRGVCPLDPICVPMGLGSYPDTLFVYDSGRNYVSQGHRSFPQTLFCINQDRTSVPRTVPVSNRIVNPSVDRSFPLSRVTGWHPNLSPVGSCPEDVRRGHYTDDEQLLLLTFVEIKSREGSFLQGPWISSPVNYCSY